MIPFFHLAPGPRIALLGLCVVVLAQALGCGQEGGDSAQPWPSELIPSDRLAPHLDGEVVRNSTQVYGDESVVAQLELRDELLQGIYDPQTRDTASQRLYETWKADPANPLWPDTAAQGAQFLVDPDLVFSVLDTPVCADTTTAIGAYMRAWDPPRIWNMVPWFESAYARTTELEPFPRVWIGLKAAYAARHSGRYEVSLERAFALLEPARELGGGRLESYVWAEISRASLKTGEYDDALIAAILADTLATLAVPDDGAVVGLLKMRELRADVLATRRDAREAFARYERNIQDAQEHGLPFVAGIGVNKAAALADALGDLDLVLQMDRLSLGLALSDADSLNVPRYMMNLAHDHRLMGELDSCLVYQTEAERWVQAYPHPRNRARMPLLQAEYYTQIGATDVVDSLLESAMEAEGVEGTEEARAELHLELIRGWMEIGRPDLVYRSIAAIQDLGEGFVSVHADRHVVADLNLLAGEFLTRRGEYARAQESLDRAAKALDQRDNAQKRWVLARNRGLLDRARDNPRGAERWFQECIRIGEELGIPEMVSTGQVLLGAVRLDMGDQEGARAAFPSTDPADFVGRVTSRILALLLTGRSYLDEGRLDAALASLREARAACRSWTPDDLVGRVELEMGRVLAASGDRAGAVELYETVARRIEDVDFDVHGTEELAYFNGDLRRDCVEAWLELGAQDPEASLRFACGLLPRWIGGAEGLLSSPQLVYFVGERLSGRWTVDGSRVSWTRLPGSAELTKQLAVLLADLGVPGTTVDERALGGFSDLLLDGVESTWPRGKTLRIVPDLELFEVPWAALRLPGGDPGDGAGGGTELVDYGPCVVLERPSFQGQPGPAGPPTGQKLLVIASDGDPGRGLDRLRHAEDEAREIAARWTPGAVDLALGPQAADALSEGRELGAYRAIHVASHAMVYAGQADRTTLILPGTDEGTTSAAEVGDLDLSAELVFLSACEAGDGAGTRSVHVGLARSFLDAGARQVIAPISVIDDEAAREFAVGFYENWKPGQPAAEALRAAQIRQRDHGRDHPFYWAFYQVYADKK